MNRIYKRLNLISEGKKIKDKIKILFFILTFGKYKPRVWLKNLDGNFLVRPNSSDLWMLSTIGEWEMRPYFNLKRGVFIDVGANVGKYTVMVGKKLKNKGKVIAFEPEPSNLKALRKNISMNNIKNVKILPLACSNKKNK